MVQCSNECKDHYQLNIATCSWMPDTGSLKLVCQATHSFSMTAVQEKREGLISEVTWRMTQANTWNTSSFKLHIVLSNLRYIYLMPLFLSLNTLPFTNCGRQHYESGWPFAHWPYFVRWHTSHDFCYQALCFSSTTLKNWELPGHEAKIPVEIIPGFVGPKLTIKKIDGEQTNPDGTVNTLPRKLIMTKIRILGS